MEKAVPVGISFPKTFVKEIDNLRGDISRSRYILRLLRIGIEQQMQVSSQQRRTRTGDGGEGYPDQNSAAIAPKPRTTSAVRSHSEGLTVES